MKFTIDRATAQVISRDGFDKLTPGNQARQFVRWLHTGEAGGAWGQTLSALAATATIVLVYTGFALAWRRNEPLSEGVRAGGRYSQAMR